MIVTLQITPLPEQGSQFCLGDTWLFEVAGGIMTQWETHCRGCSPAQTVLTGLTVPEKSGSREKSWTSTDCYPQGLQMGQSVGLGEKLGVC